MAIDKIHHKWVTSAQNNPISGQQPNTCRMEPPMLPAVSTHRITHRNSGL